MRLYLSGAGRGSVTGFCAHGNEHTVSVSRDSRNDLRDGQRRKEDFAC